MTQADTLLIFDLALGGHHGQYIYYLVEHLYKQSYKGEVYIVVAPEFFVSHKSTVLRYCELQPSECTSNTYRRG